MEAPNKNEYFQLGFTLSPSFHFQPKKFGHPNFFQYFCRLNMTNSTISQELPRRRDMRETLTFTIDPEDAKDFDDALSFEVLDADHYQVGVHIADVTFYVKPGSDIDKRAYELGTSTYLVDQVLPMLPEELCNDLCSLRPNEEKLAMSVIFTMTHDARVEKYKVCRTVIRSDARLTYEQAQAIIADPKDNSPIHEALKEINFLALILRQNRLKAGALAIEQEEIRFRLDDEGNPVEIYFHRPSDANHLIEEFMLLANRTIATHIGQMNKEMVYRVHDTPDQDKLKDVQRFSRYLKGMDSPKDATRNFLDMLTVRAMAKAVYDTQNIGHYGLAFDYYTHFTSPIRRYPDMMVHRLVARYILGERGKAPVVTEAEDLREACDHCSSCEQLATQAERDSIKYYQTLWMSRHVGETMEVMVSSVTDFGLFVQSTENHCEGLVPIRTICPGQYLQVDDKHFCIRTKTKPETVYHLGDILMAKVVSADIDKRQINFELV